MRKSIQKEKVRMKKKKDRRKEGKEGKEDERGIFLVRPICLISYNPILSYPIDYRHKKHD